LVADSVGLILLHGGESLLVDRALSRILVSHPGAQMIHLESSEIELGAITDALAPSLFGEDRIVMIREIQDLASELQTELLGYLQSPDESVTLTLWHKGGVKGKAFLDSVKKLNPEIIACDGIKKESEKLEFVHSEFKRFNRKITPGATAALVAALGSDLRELVGACSQLASDVASEKIIDESDVDRYHQGRVETTGFDVADAVLDGKVDSALISLRNALATGVDPVLIISALANSIRTLVKVSGASRGLKSFDLASSLGLPPWQIDKARRQLGGWSPATLATAVITIAQADADIKGAAADSGYALERAIIKIATSKLGTA
jgi:DNA polymerase-3 subunit delta